VDYPGRRIELSRRRGGAFRSLSSGTPGLAA
jgi:hypothetical protein